MSTTTSTLPGNPDLASSEESLRQLAAIDNGRYKYKVEDYFAKPRASSFNVSPDGTYISYLEKDDAGKRHVMVKERSTNAIKRVVEEKDELIRGYGWVNNERLIYAMDKGGDENYQLYAVNVDGTDTRALTPFDGVKASILRLLKEDKDHIIISMNRNNPAIFDPYKLNVITGTLEQLYNNDDEANPITGYDFDKGGNLKAFTRIRDGVFQDLYYINESGTYDLLKSLDWKDAFSILGFDYSSDNSHQAYVISNLEGDKTKIVLYDLRKDEKICNVFSHEDYDVAGISVSRKRNYEIDYFRYEGEKKVTVPVSDFYKKLDARFKETFGDKQYGVADKTDEEDYYLIFVNSDRDYGTYYAYDVIQDSFEEIYKLMPQLREEDMVEMRPITFTSRDGLELNGYISLPAAATDGTRVPVIVNPHGGPQGIRNSWGFNPEAQLFASRGYATLQVNFRISGGYGRTFLEAGFKHIGRKAMDDVEDGLQYVIDQGWVDHEKVAIYGGSHGGYAVLRGLTKTPELYACGIDYVGVSNLFTFMQTIPPYWKPYLRILKEIWYDEEVAEEKQIMEEVSPVYQLDKIKKPLFVVQGANDPRVNIDESDQIVSALREKGVDVPYMVKYDEGHGFAKEHNSLDFYRAMMGFLAKHLKELQ